MKERKDGYNGVVEAIYKLNVLFFVLKNTGETLQTQRKHQAANL